MLVLHGKQYRQDAFDGVAYLAEVLLKYVDIEVQYLMQSLSTREALQSAMVDVCFTTLKYTIESRLFLKNGKFGECCKEAIPSLQSSLAIVRQQADMDIKASS